MHESTPDKIVIRDLDLAFGSFVLIRDINARIKRGSIFIVMGGSGCGKTTLFRNMVGLLTPSRGDVLYDGRSFVHAEEDERQSILRRCGILFQSGALWSSMTLGENISLPLVEFTEYPPNEIQSLVSLKLALVGLSGFENYYPSQISGGMRKRAALARAMALDPEVLFFDEPSAGLDPVTAKRLDELIVQLRDSLGATIIMVTHELNTILSIGDDSVFLDPKTKSVRAHGNPRELLKSSTDPVVLEFLTRGQSEAQSNESTETSTASIPQKEPSS